MLKPCRACKLAVASDATFCPHCGAPRPVPAVWPAVFALGALLLLAGTCFFGGGDGDQAPATSVDDRRTERIRARLAFLDSVPEIAWVEVEGNEVYIGWRELPPDLRAVVNFAAAHANEAIRFGAHVYSALNVAPGWRPGQPGFICSASARGGRVTDSDC